MHKALRDTASSHVMGRFGSTAEVYASLSSRSHPYSSAAFPRACHPCTIKFSPVSRTLIRRLCSDATNRSSKLSVQNSRKPDGFRHVSWFAKINTKPVEFNGLSEEDAKAAILEKVMKGRQPTDLMLRCE
jgi:magnesium transporter